MTVEMPDDIASEMADKLGLYGDPRCDYVDQPDKTRAIHMDNCDCRILFIPALVQRIRDAVHADDRFNGLELVRTEERRRLAMHGVGYH